MLPERVSRFNDVSKLEDSFNFEDDTGSERVCVGLIGAVELLGENTELGRNIIGPTQVAPGRPRSNSMGYVIGLFLKILSAYDTYFFLGITDS